MTYDIILEPIAQSHVLACDGRPWYCLGMTQQIDAIYDHGVLRPLEPLALPDQTRVKLTVETNSAAGPSPANADFDAELQSLLFDGPSLPPDSSRADFYADHD